MPDCCDSLVSYMSCSLVMQCCIVSSLVSTFEPLCLILCSCNATTTPTVSKSTTTRSCCDAVEVKTRMSQPGVPGHANKMRSVENVQRNSEST